MRCDLMLDVYASTDVAFRGKASRSRMSDLQYFSAYGTAQPVDQCPLAAQHDPFAVGTRSTPRKAKGYRMQFSDLWRKALQSTWVSTRLVVETSMFILNLRKIREISIVFI